MSTEKITETLARHQRESQGITASSPDTCHCGVEVRPPAFDPLRPLGRGEPQQARDLAFGRHQSAMIAEATS